MNNRTFHARIATGAIALRRRILMGLFFAGTMFTPISAVAWTAPTKTDVTGAIQAIDQNHATTIANEATIVHGFTATTQKTETSLASTPLTMTVNTNDNSIAAAAASTINRDLKKGGDAVSATTFAPATSFQAYTVKSAPASTSPPINQEGANFVTK